MKKIVPYHHPDNQSLIWFQGPQELIDKINTYIRYKNGCPIIMEITFDNQSWWHEKTINTAGGLGKCLEAGE